MFSTHTTQGWLTISHDITDSGEGQKRYCVLSRDDRKLYFFLDQESALIKPPFSPSRHKFGPESTDGGIISSMKRSGTNTLTLSGSDGSPFQRNSRTSRSFRERVKSFKSKKPSPRQETHSSTSGSVLHGSSVSRSKSMRQSDGDLILPRMRGGRSLDNLHRISTGDSEGQLSLGEPGTYVDLATKGTLSIQMVHPSVSPRHSCFCIITEYDRLYASCGSAEELDKWITSLNECHRPNRDHLRRLSTQVCIWVFEARNLQPKKRYFCQIFLNGILYCQTCCKTMQDILFWGEPFFFEELPMLGSIQVKLFKETFKKRDSIIEPIGKIDIPTLSLDSGTTEKWHPIILFQPPKTPLNPKEVPAIRIKVQYQVVSILPLKSYDNLLKYIKVNFAVLCEVLEPKISAKTKDEIAQTLLRILEHCGKAKEFLCDIIMAEVQHVDNVNLIFRGNTFATKAVDTYMKMVGDQYLRETLKTFICDLLVTDEDCEVDPTKLSPTVSLQSNQLTLTRLVEKVWIDILSSWTRFPSDLRDTLCGIRQRFGTDREDACFKLISGSIFLRFFCPAILSPSLFQLCQEYPDEKTARKLTLVAKVIQNLANLTRFGVKEEYMCFMNEFVEREIKNMKQFIDRISSAVPKSYPIVDWGPFHIDVGRELSITHTILLSLLPSLSENSLSRISELPDILENITHVNDEANEDPFSSTFEALRVMQSTISKFTPQSLKAQTLSNSSSEYTTPAQSTSTSPTSERRPLSQAVLGLSPTHTRQISAPVEWSNNSPYNSTNNTPVHIQITKPPLGHRPSSSMPQQQLTQLQDSPNNSPPSHTSPSSQTSSELCPEVSLSQEVLEIPSIPRRNSDSVVQRHSIKLPSSKSIESNLSFRFDQTIHLADLTAENSELMQERDKLKFDLMELKKRVQTLEKENDKLKQDLLISEELRKKSEDSIRSLRENRGKVLRGLSTQTEIATAQLERDFEYLKKQIETKNELIKLQERKVKSLVEANCTLRNGLEQVQMHSTATGGLETESEEDDAVHNSIANGNGVTSVQVDLAKFIKQLDL